MNYTKEFFQKTGAIGGASRSMAKIEAARKNGFQGGRKKKLRKKPKTV